MIYNHFFLCMAIAVLGPLALIPIVWVLDKVVAATIWTGYMAGLTITEPAVVVLDVPGPKSKIVYQNWKD